MENHGPELSFVAKNRFVLDRDVWGRECCVEEVVLGVERQRGVTEVFF